MKTWLAYLLICVFGIGAITLRLTAMNCAAKGASTLAEATELPPAEREPARLAARRLARTSDRISLLSLSFATAFCVVWFGSRRWTRIEPTLPALLLILYLFSFLIVV